MSDRDRRTPPIRVVEPDRLAELADAVSSRRPRRRRFRRKPGATSSVWLVVVALVGGAGVGAWGFLLGRQTPAAPATPKLSVPEESPIMLPKAELPPVQQGQRVQTEADPPKNKPPPSTTPTSRRAPPDKPNNLNIKFFDLGVPDP